MSSTGGRSSVSYRIRPAQPGDARAILTIYQHGFPAALRPLTALGCPGALGYVTALIDESRWGGATPFWVACHAADGNEAVVGFVQWRLAVDTAVLNNIYVAPEAQGTRVGTMLLSQSLESLPWSCPTIALDVFHHNNRARQWYERLGFSQCDERGWYTSESWAPTENDRSLSMPDAGRDYLLDGLPQADAVHRDFGFSQFQVITAQGTHRIGRLGNEWFRLFSPASLSDEAVLAALHALDPKRRLFLIDESDWKPERHSNLVFSEVARSHRMQAPRDVVLARLD